MMTCKRTILILLIGTALLYIGYEIYLILQPVIQTTADRQYVDLVDRYQVLKMQRLVLEEQNALAKIKKIRFGATHSFDLASNHPLRNTSNFPALGATFGKHQETESIGLSLAQAKTFEQLEAYVSSTRPSQTQHLTKDEEYILKQPADSFTLQLMGVRDSSELTRFVQEQALQEARIVHTYYLNKDWYVLVCGLYKNHTEALKAIDTLPTGIKALKPWIRQVSSLQRAIQLYRN